MRKIKHLAACKTKDCSVEYYAKDFCKAHYMAANRDKFNPVKTSIKKPEFDYEDFWQFVKKELNIG
jgi:hypothetical protein